MCFENGKPILYEQVNHFNMTCMFTLDTVITGVSS